MASTPECPICRGSRKVALPIYHPLTPEQGLPEIKEGWRSYPCPECAGIGSPDCLDIIEVHTEVAGSPMLFREPGFRDAVSRELAAKIADFLLRKHLIRFNDVKINDTRMGMHATVGVISQTQVATMQKRIREHQEKIAREVAENAIASIQMWGSHYGWNQIHKSEAVDAINRALRAVTKKVPT